jgi:hypothetical protein
MTDEGCFLQLDSGDFAHARRTHDSSPPPKKPGLPSENTPISSLGGSLVMADVRDFHDTFVKFEPDVVVTMCSKPCRIPEGHDGTWHLFYINGYHTAPKFAHCYAEIVECIRSHLEDNRTVLIHCLDGRDRTGIVGLALMMLARPKSSHMDIVREMVDSRPKREKDWITVQGLLLEGKEYHRTATAVVELLKHDDA